MAFLPLDDEIAPQLLPHLDPEERSARWHLVTPLSEDLTEGAGLIALMATLGTTRWLARIVVQVRAGSFLSWFSRKLSVHRGVLGRFVPDVEGPRRYP